MMLHAGESEQSYQRLVSIYGATDFERVSGRRAGLLLSLVLGSRDRAVWRERSPTRTEFRAPLLLVHGTEDRLVPVQHALSLHETRSARGLPTELELVDGMRHGWLNDASLPETHATVERVLRFLDGG
jgi:alpha-beta hydrolase superfamily lysophospholipase